MTNNNHNHATCELSESLLVSYLYDEIGAADESRFESHVLNCRICADELVALGGARTAFREWRNVEFAPLATPVFEMPRQERLAASPLLETASDEKPSPFRLASLLRRTFSLSPVWTGAATACAALAIGFGLFYGATVWTPRADQNLAAGENQPVVTSPIANAAPATDNSNSFETGEKSEENKSGKLPTDNFVVNTKPQRALIVRNEAQAKAAAKSPVRTKQSKKAVNQTAVRKIRRDAEIEFSGRVEEDHSLRLADLFDDVSMK